MIRPLIFGLSLVALTIASPIAAKKDKRPPAGSRTGWQAVITSQDRDRLRTWRQSWVEGRDQARAEGFGAAIAKEGAVLDPDSGQNEPGLAEGQYRCRVFKLGKRGLGPAFKIMPETRCLIRGQHFEISDGPQRPGGHLWDYDGTRYLFLGSISVGDDQARIPYGHDRERDSLGLFERIGPNHWRLTLPRPAWESLVDVIDIQPVG